MTEHTNRSAKKGGFDSSETKGIPKERTMSFYHNAEFRADFTLLAAAAVSDIENLNHLKETVVPKLAAESRKNSKTPRLDRAFIEGVVLGVSAVRALYDVKRRI